MEKSKYEVLQTTIEYIQKLNNGITQAASYYRNGQLAKGHEYVGVITEGIEWVIDVIALTQDVLVREVETNGIRDLIGEYIEAMENEDTVLMADLLEYEIVEEIQRWQDVVIESVDTFRIEDCDEA